MKSFSTIFKMVILIALTQGCIGKDYTRRINFKSMLGGDAVASDSLAVLYDPSQGGISRILHPDREVAYRHTCIKAPKESNSSCHHYFVFYENKKSIFLAKLLSSEPITSTNFYGFIHKFENNKYVVYRGIYEKRYGTTFSKLMVTLPQNTREEALNAVSYDVVNTLK